jgi:hypothetical protein
MTRRARTQIIDNIVAIIAWIGLFAAVFAGFGDQPQLWLLAVASLVIQAMTGGLR